MNGEVSGELKTVLTSARKIALRHQYSLIRIEHVLFAIMDGDNVINAILKRKIRDYSLLLSDVFEFLKRHSEGDENITKESIIQLDINLQKTMKECFSNNKRGEKITLADFFIRVFVDDDNAIISMIKDAGVTKEYMSSKLQKLMVPEDSLFTSDGEKKDEQIKITETKSKTPVLDSFSRDLTVLASEGKLDPVIGRIDEIERVAQILSRRKKNNPILIGDGGVGKTIIIEGLALKIVNNECPRTLQNKRVVSLDLTSLVAGTKYRGQFEERIKTLLNEIHNNRDIILFIDEIHTLVGAGNSTGSLDAANAFKPALARGEIQCIGTTTLDEYREHIEKDGALDRRFQKIIVNPPNLEQTKTILMNIRNKYEDFHNVEYTEAAIDEIIRLSDRYINNREFPDKAIDVLDEAGSRAQVSLRPSKLILDLEKQLQDIKIQKIDVVQTQNFERAVVLRDQEKTVITKLDIEKSKWLKQVSTERTVITEEMICEVVAMMTGIPLSKINQNEIKKLINIDKELANTVIGQEKAIEKVSWAIKRNRTGIRRKSRPIGSFLFIGPSGVGKTQLAKTLTEKVFGSTDALIRIDMSEYSEKFNITKLIGSPPGFVGYGEGGHLTEKVKNKPYSLVLFDEIEKAHPDVFNLLLQLLDEGHLTDSNGRKINFKNTIIVLTSNIGLKEAQEAGQSIGFQSSVATDKNVHSIIEKNLKKTFKPEFINRLDDIIYFNYLTEENIEQIVELQLNELKERLLESNYIINFTGEVKKHLGIIGYDKNFGVRELQRTIQKNVEDPISQTLLEHNMPSTGIFSVSFDSTNETLIFDFKIEPNVSNDIR